MAMEVFRLSLNMVSMPAVHIILASGLALAA